MTDSYIDTETNRENCRALVESLCTGAFDPARVQDLLSRISDLNVADENGTTPLIAAVRLQSIEAVKAILDAPVDVPADINFLGAPDIQLTGVDSVTYALKAAIENDGKDMVEFLISRGAKANLSQKDITQPLNACLEKEQKNSAAIFEILCRSGADILFADEEGMRAVACCMILFGSFPSATGIGAFRNREDWLRHKLVTMQKFSGLDLNGKASDFLIPVNGDKGESILARVVTHPFSNAAMVDAMLDIGMRVDVPDDRGQTVHDYVMNGKGAEHPSREKIQQKMRAHVQEWLTRTPAISAPVVHLGPRKLLRFAP